MLYALRSEDIKKAKEDLIVVPTNLTLKKTGALVMGAGLAKWLRRTIINVDYVLGDEVAKGNDGPIFCGHLSNKFYIAFPTKRDWKDKADINLIEQNLQKLIQAIAKIAGTGSVTCAVPKLGCGLGGLDWNDVRPLMFKYLDDSFVCYGI